MKTWNFTQSKRRKRSLLLCSLCCLLLNLFVPELRANNTITVGTIAFTNSTGPSNGAIITINGTTLTFTNSVVIPSAQVLTNGTPTGATTNLFNELTDNPANILNLLLSYGTGGTNLVLTTLVNGSLTVTVQAVYGAYSAVTTTLTNAYTVRVPITVEQAPNQTNIASLIVSALEESTNASTTAAYYLTNFMSLGGIQAITGGKNFTGAVCLSNAPILVSPILTNGVNRGNPFSSPGAGGGEVFGAGAVASGNNSLALFGTASGDFSVSIGGTASGLDGTVVGESAQATKFQDLAMGYHALAQGGNSLAIGSQAQALFTNSTAIGPGAQATATNQVMLGTAGISTVVQNNLTVQTNASIGGYLQAGSISNIVAGGTNVFAQGADLSFGRFPISSLANGNNADVVVGTNVFCDVSGPSGAFTINGLAGGRDGKFIILVNRSGQVLTVANDSGVDPVAANRIYTSTGANVVAANANCSAMLIYNANITHWILLFLQ